MNRLKRLFFSLAILLSFSFPKTIDCSNQQELPFVFVVASYNNKDWYKLNLDSIFSQNYTNYRVIYIDDVSPDGTGDLVEQYLVQHNLFDKTTLIKNKDRRLAMANLYMAIHMCDDDEIVFVLDGDDWLKHDNVLRRVNQEYQTKDIWLTYGSYEDIYGFGQPRVRRCSDIHRAIKNNNIPIRKNKTLLSDKGQFIPGHPKTFYAWLFKQIKLKDFLYKGKFAPTSYDNVIGFPMHQMARNNFSFIHDVLYVHNAINALNDHKVHNQTQRTVSKSFVDAPETYFPLSGPTYTSCKKSLNADVLILSNNADLQLTEQLEAIANTPGVDNIIVLTDFDFNSGDWRENLTKQLESSPNKYILLLDSNSTLSSDTNISECIKLMERTFAYTFHLQNETTSKKALQNYVVDGVCAWQFKHNKNITPKTFDCALYLKKDLISFLKQIKETRETESLKFEWVKSTYNVDDIGLTIS